MPEKIAKNKSVDKNSESGRSKYRTRHREELTRYLQSRSGEHATVNDIRDALRIRGISMGTTTIYRQLERLMEEGKIRKYMIDSSTCACFEYIGEAETQEYVQSFHCKCEKCGSLIHLHCKELEGIRMHIENEHNFTINPAKTVFYGICDKCAEKPE